MVTEEIKPEDIMAIRSFVGSFLEVDKLYCLTVPKIQVRLKGAKAEV